MIKLAAELDVAPQTLDRVVRGRGDPSVALLRRVCAALGVSPDELLGWATAADSPSSLAAPAAV